MTKSNAAITSLASLTMDMSVQPVRDELTALSRLRPTAPTLEEAYALMMHQTPTLTGIAARGRHHAGEVKRFLTGAAQTRELAVVHRNLPAMWAVTLLNHASAIAIALLPSTGPSDARMHAATGQAVLAATGQAVLAAALENGHKEEVSTIREAFGLDGQADPTAAIDAETVGDADSMADGADGSASAVSVEGGPTLHTIEHTGSLSAFLTRSCDLQGLLAEAREHLDHADRFAAWLEDGDRPFAERDRLERALAGARLLAVAALARIGLAPVRLDDSRTVRIETSALIKNTSVPPRLKAIALLAGWMGGEVRSQISWFEPPLI
jgi:hypothetical protein